MQIEKMNFKKMSEMFMFEQKISIIAGPCTIESHYQMDKVAATLVRNNIKFIRGGAFKPRTSPYSFQGLGIEGLKILSDVCKKHDLISVSEIIDPRDIEIGLEYINVIQVGSRNMQNYSLLKELGKTNHPVLLKRGMMSTIEEFLLAAEYIIKEGNKKIIMCERGIRTFETYTRNTLDISCIAVVKQKTKLPIIADLSHSLGRKDIIKAVFRYMINTDVDGIMLEVHPEPQYSLSDSKQSLSCDEFTELLESNKLY
ncbi:MAG: bifunctional 3-deoxy-7-phosphoheptulonate synthase/chorismate mutase [Lachnospiraceae bacterium]|nr:bifunctional 3-deoxy-7-phosphoheptulonate synthase/chorismate mutase [Lachnospiraceae bacterium]